MQLRRDGAPGGRDSVLYIHRGITKNWRQPEHAAVEQVPVLPRLLRRIPSLAACGSVCTREREKERERGIGRCTTHASHCIGGLEQEQWYR